MVERAKTPAMKIHKIKDSMYDVSLWVIVGEKQACYNYFKKKYKSDWDSIMDNESLGVFIPEPGVGYFIWLPFYSNKLGTQAVIVHECLHLVMSVFRKMGISLVEESEEAYTYYLEHIYKQIVTKLSKYYAKTE